MLYSTAGASLDRSETSFVSAERQRRVDAAEAEGVGQDVIISARRAPLESNSKPFASGIGGRC